MHHGALPLSSRRQALCCLVLAGALHASGAATAASPAAPAAETPSSAPSLVPTAAPSTAAADCAAPAIARVLQPSAGQPEARAHWLSRRLIRWPGAPGASSRFALLHATQGGIMAAPGQAARGAAERWPLRRLSGALPAALAERFKFVAAGTDLSLPAAALARLPQLLQGETLLVELDPDGRVRRATALQVAGALDDRYAAAQHEPDLGATVRNGHTGFALWAPTARRAWLCLGGGAGEARHAAARALPLRPHPASGVWRTRLRGDLSGRSYRWLVEVYVRGTGWVRNRVTDPYSLSLDADSQHSVVMNLDAPAAKPPGWNQAPRPAALPAATDMAIYELHVRDFSIADASVPAPLRGKYAAFTVADSQGMRHLRALARSGITDIHLLPVFDIASIPERGCRTPDLSDLAGAPPDNEVVQARVSAGRAGDCFNWGYDPLHYTAPEGSYASDAADGAVRVRELRAMVAALHAAGLRVGMDVVYNHTPAAGQHPHSVLDRIVPGYYQRLDASGQVEHSTCCANTATEHAMMGRLLVDSVRVWARDYRIDSFRFDLMGHQPRALMQSLQRRLEAEIAQPVHLIGEGWNFGEVADGARFVQASQRSLNGSGIATFSDRARDALRGGSAGDSGIDMLRRQGFLNGLALAPNSQTQTQSQTQAQAQPQAPAAPGASAEAAGLALLRAADLVRVGLAGSISSYRLITHDGSTRPLADIRYGDQPAGYASQPGEVVNYVENHDNHTLFDANVLKLPADTAPEDRARVQLLGAASVAFSQGIAYFHAGQDLLRSKSLDRNSYDSGDAFNRLDWSGRDNGFGIGLPPAQDNAADWPLLRPLLADAARIRPTPEWIGWSRRAFADLLRIRASSTLLRLRSADEIERRLHFFNTGPRQAPGLIAAHLTTAGPGDGRLPGAGFAELVYLINASPAPASAADESLVGKRFVLHPVHRAADAADRRAAQARFDAASGRFEVPARTAVAFVVE